MRQSQKVMVGVASVVVVLIVGVAGLARSSLEKAGYEANPQGLEEVDMNDLKDFSGIASSGKWQIDVAQGKAWQVKLDYPEGMENDITAYVRNEQLVLKMNSHNGWSGENMYAKAVVIMPALEKLKIAGDASVEFSGFEGEKLAVSLAGEVDLKGRDGRYQSLDISSAGVSDIDLKSVLVTDAEVSIAGESTMILAMNGGALTGSMAGAGTIGYYGELSKQDVRVMGAGSVEHLD